MKFNLNQLNNPTPANVGRTVTIISVVLGIFVGWSASTNIIPHPADDIVNGIAGLLLAIANGIKPFFGVEVNGKTVRKEEVTEIDESVKKDS